MIRFKAGVRFKKLPEETIRLMEIASRVYAVHGFADVWVTSGNDSRHMKGSKHYEDYALDFRTGHHWADPLMTKEQAEAIVASMKEEAGPDYDIILESDHIHAEYDPKMCLV